MSEKTIEVELRGPLSEEDHGRLLSLAQSLGTPIVYQNRFLIDYSTFIEGIGERTLDVRARITNGNPELVVKKGKFGGTSREEVALPIAASDIVEATKYLALLGYRKGVACDRGIVRFGYKGVEFALQDVRTFSSDPVLHSRFFEAEIVISGGAESEAVEQIDEVLDELGLSKYSEPQWNAYIKKLNEEANGVFSADDADWGYLAKLGALPGRG